LFLSAGLKPDPYQVPNDNLELQTGVISAGESGGQYLSSLEGFPLGLNSMIDTATALLLGLFSVSIFLAHALDAATRNRAQDRSPAPGVLTERYRGGVRF
jgi:hypothetical protein